MKRVLHLLSQRPSLTGSGITLDSMVRHASRRGWDQCVVVGAAKEDPAPTVGGLHQDRIFPLVFESGKLSYPVPGMSDVMPYKSTRFSTLSQEQIDDYVDQWKVHLEGVIRDFQPNIIHTHHIWLMSSVVRDVAPRIPVVNHCHATGFRQMIICPDLKQQVIDGCKRNHVFCVLHREHADTLCRELMVDEQRVQVVGAGYREDLFKPDSTQTKDPDSLLYIGKYSHSKGVPQLLDSLEIINQSSPGIVLHVAGSGSGPEADDLARRMKSMGSSVVMHGQLNQRELAQLMCRCHTCVLPSFYEGLPLVLAEAAACGCRIVATDLEGIRTGLLPSLDSVMDLVPMPGLTGVDTPAREEIPDFVQRLSHAIERSLAKPPVDTGNPHHLSSMKSLTWSAVFDKVETIWKEAISQALNRTS